MWAEAAESPASASSLGPVLHLGLRLALACAYSVPSPGPSGLGARFSLRFPPPPAPRPLPSPLPTHPTSSSLLSAPALPLGRSSAACSPAAFAPGAPNSSSLLGALKLTPSPRPPPCAPQRPRLTRSAQRPRLTVASASARRHRAWPPPEPGFDAVSGLGPWAWPPPPGLTAAPHLAAALEPGFDAVSGFSVCAWPPLLDLTAVPAPGHRTRTRLRCPRPDSGSAPCRRTRPWPIRIDSGSVWGASRIDPAVGVLRPAVESPREVASPGQRLGFSHVPAVAPRLSASASTCAPVPMPGARVPVPDVVPALAIVLACLLGLLNAPPRSPLWPLPLFVSLPS